MFRTKNNPMEFLKNIDKILENYPNQFNLGLTKEKNNFSTKGKWISHVPYVHILNDIL